jgi:hypothetical protein
MVVCPLIDGVVIVVFGESTPETPTENELYGIRARMSTTIGDYFHSYAIIFRVPMGAYLCPKLGH